MLSKLGQGFTVISFALLLASCASVEHSPSSGGETYFDAAFNDRNRAPASMSPPQTISDGSSPLDPVHLRTQADYHFAMGEAYSLEGNPQKAIEAFKMVLVYDQASAEVNLRLSAEYVKAGMISEALENAELAVKRNPKLIDGRILLGGLYSTLKVFDKALAQYEEVLKIQPLNTEAPMYIGAVYAEKKQYDKAAKYFEALAKNEENASPYYAYYYLGRIRSEQEGPAFQKAAEMAYKKSLELKPDYVESLVALGSLYIKLDQEPKALELYRTFQRDQGPNYRVAEILSQAYLEQEKYDLALEQLEILEGNSDDILNVKVKMALVYIEQKKYDSAITKLKDILKQVPDSDKIRFYLAAVYEEIKKNSEAVEQFLRIPAASQYYGEAIVHAAYLMKQDQKVDEAVTAVKKGLEARDDLPQLYAIYASLLDEKGEYREAVTLLEKATKKFADNVQLRFFLGTLQDRIGNKDEVIANMKQVIEMDPNHVQGLNYLAFTYAETGANLDEAENLVRKALDIEPKDGFILDTLGWILYKKGQFSDSVKVLESAHKFQPSESIIAEHLGDAYNKVQLVEKAKTMYEKAAILEPDVRKVRDIRTKITILEEQQLKVGSERRPASN